ncbi:DUF7504 family protein [Haladaptatus sp. DFWS20]|uniref:DUF7504 family protein n=1 Tax=Haladaptatus sp. DFWS20 TaxID=3403467 RepID=UPI003EBDA831
MQYRGENSTSASETAAVFTRTLAGLKRRGSGLLLVGPQPAMDEACNRFLGESQTEPRQRLLVRTDGENHHTHAACAGLGSATDCTSGSNDGTTKVIERVTHTRGAAMASNAGYEGAGTDTEPETTVLTSRSLPRLGITISEVIDEFDRECGGLESGELRVCFDSLTPLLEEYDQESVFRFLHILTARIRHVNGMAHFHLPAEMDSTIINTLAPVFDAVVEVRTTGGLAEQRWQLVQQDVTTDWLSL